jgi:hypothetical protein
MGSPREQGAVLRVTHGDEWTWRSGSSSLWDSLCRGRVGRRERKRKREWKWKKSISIARYEGKEKKERMFVVVVVVVG